MSIQAIETHYNGYRFRSRLEARWAVFFDTLGIHYVYEGQGYQTPSGPYLPDFWLPQFEVWVEIKGRQPTDDEKLKASQLSAGYFYPVFIVAGQVGQEVFYACGSDGVFVDNLLPDGRIYPAWCDLIGHTSTHLMQEVKSCDEIHSAYEIARCSRFEYGETPQVIERVEYRTIERDPAIWRGVDIITRYYSEEADLTQPGVFKGIHLDDGGVPLCAPLDESKNGGFNLDKWKPRRADVLVSNLCARCIKYSLSRSKRARRAK